MHWHHLAKQIEALELEQAAGSQCGAASAT